MIDRYLEDGTLLRWRKKGTPAAVAVVAPAIGARANSRTLPLPPICAERALDAVMVEYLFAFYRGKYRKMYVGTADIPCGCKDFYQKLGFRYTHTVDGFFTENYPEPLYENGALIENMAHFVKELK